MVSAATLPNQASPTSSNAMKATPDAPAVMNPFIKASRERTLVGPSNVGDITTTAIQTQLFDVPAGGFLRYIELDVTMAGGAAGLATVAEDEDAPFTILDSIVLTDVNGNPLVGPVSGYDLYLIQKWGGYDFSCDAKQAPGYTAPDSDGDFRFQLRLPVEISARDGYGSLANMDASQTFKLQWSYSADSVVYSTSPDTLGDVTVNIAVDIWDRPPPVDARGAQNAQFPPAHGTTQYWKKATYDLQSGDVTQRLARIGNNIRNLVMIWRDTSGDRAPTTFPDPIRFQIDDHAFDLITRTRLRNRMWRQYGYSGTADTAGAEDSGVFVWNFDHDLDGKPGFSNRLGLLHTHQGTKLELIGSTGEAGVLTVLTNDIAVPAGQEVRGNL